MVAGCTMHDDVERTRRQVGTGNKSVSDQQIEVKAAERVIAIGGDYFEDAVKALQQAHVKGAAAEVKNKDGGLLVGSAAAEAVRHGCCNRLLKQRDALKASKHRGRHGGEPLRRVKVRRHGDDGTLRRLPCLLLRSLLEHLHPHVSGAAL